MENNTNISSEAQPSAERGLVDYTSLETKYGASWSRNLSMGQMSKMMLNIGEGTSGIVIDSRCFAPVHAFNVTVFEGKVMFLDFQQMILQSRANMSRFRSFHLLIP